MKKKVVRFLNTLRTSILSLFKRSDKGRWEAGASLMPEWDERTKRLASFVKRGESVIEFGAGRMVLPQFLPTGCAYTPSDIVDRGVGTIVCDFNDKTLPPIPPHDVAFFSRVLEYVYDVRRLVTALSGTVGVFVLSYTVCASQAERHSRRTNGWVSDCSTLELFEIFLENGFLPERIETFGAQELYRFVRR